MKMSATGARAGIPFALAILALLYSWKPLSFRLPVVGLDPSWALVLAEAGARGLTAGRDIILTGGPFSPLHTGFFASGSIPWILTGTAGAILTIAAAVAALSFRNGFVGAIPALFALLVINGRDGLVCALLLFTVLPLILDPAHRGARGIAATGAALIAAFALAKFAFALLGLAILVMADLALIFSRRVPFLTLIFALALAVLFWVGTRDLGALVPFVRYSLDSASGYTDAMSIWGDPLELISFIVLAVITLLIVLVLEWRAVRRNIFRPAQALPLAAILGVLIFFGFKAGFVRHDMHSLIGWDVLSLACGAYVLARWKNGALGPIPAGYFAVVPFAILLLSALFADAHLQRARFALLLDKFQSFHTELLSIRRFALSPARFIGALEKKRIQAWNAIKASYPLPEIPGTVDIIPSEQATVLASGLRYKPRYSFQEYVTYTPGLIEQNRKFFSGNKAPDFLLFSPGSIDSRHPAFAEGPQWPILISRYEPIGLDGQRAVLRRRDSPREVMLGKAVERTVAFNERFALPKLTSPVLAKFHVATNILGAAANFLFKLPSLQFEVEYEDGHFERYRLIRAIAGEGFILSPLIANSADFLTIVTDGTTARPKQRAIGAKILGNFRDKVFYRAGIDIEFVPITYSKLQSLPEAPASLQGLTRRWSAMFEVLSSGNQGVAVIPEGLLAHAPNRLPLNVKGAGSIVFQFGLVDGSWQQGRTDGVCFRVTDRNDSSVVLWERCLDPVVNQDDRGRQAAEINLPKGIEVVWFETACRANCSWDWSYWDSVERR
jgi:hypothetical protein